MPFISVPYSERKGRGKRRTLSPFGRASLGIYLAHGWGLDGWRGNGHREHVPIVSDAAVGDAIDSEQGPVFPAT